jgi:hypothetical protein
LLQHSWLKDRLISGAPRKKSSQYLFGLMRCIEFSQGDARNWPPRLIAPELLVKMMMASNVLLALRRCIVWQALASSGADTGVGKSESESETWKMYFNLKESAIYTSGTARLFALRLSLSRWSALLASLFCPATPINWTLEITMVLGLGILSLWCITAVPALLDRLYSMFISGQFYGAGRANWLHCFNRLW